MYTYTDFMGTKTISIMNDVYEMLLRNKAKEESFSDEIRRVLTHKKSGDLKKYFGLISDQEGESMLQDLKKIKLLNVKLLKEKIKKETGA